MLLISSGLEVMPIQATKTKCSLGTISPTAITTRCPLSRVIGSSENWPSCAPNVFYYKILECVRVARYSLFMTATVENPSFPHLWTVSYEHAPPPPAILVRREFGRS